MAFDAQSLAQWMANFAALIAEHEAELTEFDRLIGDGDHGVNMLRGTKAVAELDASESASGSDYLKAVAMTLLRTVGGAAGPLYGTFMLRASQALASEDATEPTIWPKLFEAGVAGIQQRGKAVAGDKTMLDALIPALEAYQAKPDGWQEALAAAQQGRQATIDMVARKGRASYLGPRSAGTTDPGAASATLLVQAAAQTFGSN